jgi:hypothetical protein
LQNKFLYLVEQTMSKHLSRLTSVILAFSLALGVFTPGEAKPESAGLMPSSTVNLAHFYKPPSNSTAETLASNYDFIILSGTDEPFRNELIAKGYGNTILQYFGFIGVQDPGSCTATPRMNQVAYKPGDFCSLSKKFPDWFLLDNRGRRIPASPGSDTYRMDPGHPGWRAFFLKRVLDYQAQKGWSGLFLDNLEASLSFIQRDGRRSAKYPDDASYQAAIRGFLQNLKVNYAQALNRPMVANIIARQDSASWFGYLPYLDGAMQESWAVDWALDQYVSVDKWKSDLVLAEKTQEQGKHIVLVSQGRYLDAARQQFAYASYLLITNGKAAFRYANAAGYRQVWPFSNYKIDLGTPLGSRYQSGNLWRRDFTKGYVIVDPVSHTATISIATGP